MKLEMLENVKVVGDVCFGKCEGFYLADKSTGIKIAFRCSDCGNVFTLDDEDECILLTCKECASSDMYDDLRPGSEMYEDRKRRLEEHFWQKPIKDGDFNF